MGASHFDALSRALARIGTRRGVLGGLALGPFGLLAGTGLRDATAKKCSKIGNRKKRNRCRRKNLPPPAAFGCTAEINSCSPGGPEIRCPDKQTGVCNVTFDGLPMCTEDGSVLCVGCGRHDTCRNLLGSKSARCIDCPDCADGLNRACLRAAQ